MPIVPQGRGFEKGNFDTGENSGAGRGIQTDPSGKRTFGDKFTEWSLNWVPDSMVFVISLTMVVYVAALVLTPRGPLELLDDYAAGFWVLLTFAMQLALMMITGFVVADSKPVKAGMVRLISLTTTARSTLITFCLIVGVVTCLHWGEVVSKLRGGGRPIADIRAGASLQHQIVGGRPRLAYVFEPPV